MNIIVDKETLLKTTKKVLKQMSEVITSTLGPQGKNVIINDANKRPFSTKDGVTVAKAINFDDPIEQTIATIIKQAAESTVKQAGDGPQPLYSKVLTDCGWKKMGEIQIGDRICGSNNSFQTVLAVFPKGKKQIYKIVTSDGRTIECCGDHLWKITNYFGKEMITTTEKLFNSGVTRKNKNGYFLYKYYIPDTSVDFKNNDEELELDPYLLGVLLGDGYLGNNKKNSVEISLGYNKKHILEKINLPKGCELSFSDNPNKNAFKIKIIGCDSNRKSIIKNLLSKIGLLGKKCEEKFIPAAYLFSNIENRKKLLQGLIDTDGHINKRGLFEFSTINERLYSDFVDLCRSLGKPIHSYKLKNRKNSYSTTPIYRVIELKGYKYGIKIKEIIKTNKTTEMQCIKVSNLDNLYITDDFVLTHNTTSSILFLNNLYEGLNSLEKKNLLAVKQGLNLALKDTLGELVKISKPVDDIETIKNIATLSANNDPDIGNIIAKAVEVVGENGSILIKNGNSNTTEAEFIEGYRFDSGLTSKIFVTDEIRGVCKFNDCLVFVSDMTFTSVDDILPVVTHGFKSNRPLIIVADVKHQALAVLANQYLEGRKVACVELPKYGEARHDMLDDFALAIGATFYSKQSGKNVLQFNPNDFGSCDSFESSKFFTNFVGLKGSAKDITNRVEHLKEVIQKVDHSGQQMWLQERIDRLSTGFAVINVGGSTEIEVTETKHRIEDALEAVKCAQMKGILPGGGKALLHVKNILMNNPKLSSPNAQFGYETFLLALSAPFEKLYQNSFHEFPVYASLEKQLKNLEDGYDFKNRELVNLFDRGIIEPLQVVESVLKNATSVVISLMFTDSMVIKGK